MLLAFGLAPHAREVAQAMFLVFLAATLLFGGWLTGQWITGPLEQDRALPFAPSFWAFTFSYSAVALDAIQWIKIERPAGAALIGYTLLAAITLFIGAIAARSIVAVWNGRFFPAPTS